MSDRVRLELDGAIAIVTNDNPEKHNAFDDEMDASLFEILSELRGRSEVRAVVWRGEGKSFSSGRDVSAIGAHAEPVSHHELMRRGHRGIQQLWDLDAPVIVACKGWSWVRRSNARCCATCGSRQKARAFASLSSRTESFRTRGVWGRCSRWPGPASSVTSC